MPIGNLTSQFFANVYLNELDQFAKHKLKAKYYIRYVDDFVIIHNDKRVLQSWKASIDYFLNETLKVELHPEKTKIVPITRGVTLLGFRVFYNRRLLKKSNSRRILKRINKLKRSYDKGEISMETANHSLDGWLAYAEFADSYNLRMRAIARFNELFNVEQK